MSNESPRNSFMSFCCIACWIHFFIKIYLSHFILERVDAGCAWEMSWRRGQTATYWPSSTSFSSWLGCSTVGQWGHKAPSLQAVLTLTSCLQLTQTVCALVILLFNVYLLPLFFRLFTQVHLLIDGSVEGQYITLFCFCSLNCRDDVTEPAWER